MPGAAAPSPSAPSRMAGGSWQQTEPAGRAPDPPSPGAGWKEENMRTRSLAALALIAASAVPFSSQAAGGTYQVTETLTIEADIDAPIPTRLVAIMRTRRVATLNVNPASPGQPYSGNSDERSVTVSLVYTGPGEESGSMLCFVDSSKAAMTSDHQDGATLKVTAASCPMELTFAPDSDPIPFVRGLAAGGADAHNGFETGYARRAKALTGKLFGDDARVYASKMTRATSVAARPTTDAGAPNVPNPPQPPSEPPALPPAPTAPEVPLPDEPPALPEP